MGPVEYKHGLTTEHARRLDKYSTRGFAVGVPGFDPERVRPGLLNGKYAHFSSSGLLLECLPEYVPVTELRADHDLPLAVVTKLQRGRAVYGLSRLVVMNKGYPLVLTHDADANFTQRGRSRVTIPLSAGCSGEYFIVAFLERLERLLE